MKKGGTRLDDEVIETCLKAGQTPEEISVERQIALEYVSKFVVAKIAGIGDDKQGKHSESSNKLARRE